MLAYDKATKWDHTNIMRGPVGCLVYDRHYERDTCERDLEHYEDISAIKSVPHLIVFLYANEDTVISRLKEEGNTISSILPPGVTSYKQLVSDYRDAIFENYNKENILVLNSSELSIEEEVEKIKKRIKKIKSHPINTAVDIMASNIRSRNASASDSTYTQFVPIQRMYTQEKLESFEEFDKSVDPIYYDMLSATLKHKLYERRLGWINDRQIVYTSDDCISLIQLVPLRDKDGYEIFYNIFVHQRSCDIEKHKTNDLTFFADFMKHNLKNIPYNLYYTCAVPHTYKG